MHMYTYGHMKVFITATAIVAATIWWMNRQYQTPQRPVRLHDPSNQTKRNMDLLQPKPTLAPDSDEDVYKIVYKDVADAIRSINREAKERDECGERFVVQELPQIVDGVYSKSLTSEESRKCANIAVDALNTALGQEDRLTIVFVDNGLKVAPSQHIMVPFLYYDVQSNSSAKLVVTLGQLVQDECDVGAAKHAIQQIAPFNTVEPHWQ